MIGLLHHLQSCDSDDVELNDLFANEKVIEVAYDVDTITFLFESKIQLHIRAGRMGDLYHEILKQ